MSNNTRALNHVENSEGEHRAVRKPWLAVVGSGRWGSRHVQTASRMGILCAVVDQDDRQLSALSNLEFIQTSSTIEELLSSPPENLRAVVIATPPDTHASLAEIALRAGLSVLVEKPMCTSLGDARRLAELAYQRRDGQAFLVGHLTRYAPEIERAVALVRAGYIGSVTRVEATRVNYGTVRTTENVLWSLAPHDISVALATCAVRSSNKPREQKKASKTTSRSCWDKDFLGDDCHDNSANVAEKSRAGAWSEFCVNLPSRIRASGHSVFVHNSGVEDHVEVFLEFTNGSVASIKVSWLSPEKQRRTVVYGTTGSIVVDELAELPAEQKVKGYKWTSTTDNHEVVRSALCLEKRETPVDELDTLLGPNESSPFVAPLERELRHFEDCVWNKKIPRTGAGDGESVIAVLQAATLSMRERDGDWVSLDDPALTQELPDTPHAMSALGRPATVPVKGVPGIKRVRASGGGWYSQHETAVVDPGAIIGAGAWVWHFAHVNRGALVGCGAVLGQGVYVGGRGAICAGARVQNGVSVFDGVRVGRRAFVGPGAVFTNVRRPRVGVRVAANDYETTDVGDGATVGAAAVIVCGVSIGRHALVGAGAVVTRNVQHHAQVVGNPARFATWVGASGRALETASDGEGVLVCPLSGNTYKEAHGSLRGCPSCDE